MNVSHDCFLLPILIDLGGMSTSGKMMEHKATEIFTECVRGGTLRWHLLCRFFEETNWKSAYACESRWGEGVNHGLYATTNLRYKFHP